MLVLSRKLFDTIVLDGDIRIMVVGIRGNQVRLGIEAPSTVGILRQELRVPAATGEGRPGPTATGGRQRDAIVR